MSFFNSAKSYYRKFFSQQSSGSFIQGNFSFNDTISKRDQLRLYRGYPYAIISAISEEVGRVRFFAYQELPDGSIKEVPTHPFLKVLRNPHPDWTTFEFFEMAQTLIELTGEMFIYAERGETTKEPKALDLIRPDRVKVAIDDETGIITGYAVEVGPGLEIPLEKEELICIKMPNPENFYRGLGTPEAALDYLQTEQQAAKFTKNSILNNGAPAGLVTLNNMISNDDFEEVKRKWSKEYSGTNNAGKTAFIRKADVTYTKIGSTLAEMAMDAVSKMSKEDVMAMWRTSKVVLGITEDVNYNNGSNAKRMWLENVIEPKMFRLTNGFDPFMQLYTMYKDVKIGFRSPVPEDETAKVSYFEKGQNRWLTINDIRLREKLEPIDGGDTIYQPINYVPVSDTPAEPQTTKSVKVTVKKKIKTFDLTYEMKENFRQSVVLNQERYAKVFWDKVKKMVEKQRKESLSNIGKSVTKTAGDVTFDEARWVKEFNDTLTPLVYELAKLNGQLALDLSGNEAPFVLTDVLANDLASHIDKMSRSYNLETLETLKDSLAEGILAQESVEKLTVRVNDIFNFAKRFRAERIARSETQYASNTAAVNAYKQNPYVISKEWFANPGACEFCVALQGKVVELDTPFELDGATIYGIDESGEKTGNTYTVSYGDVGSPPAHPNCTCTVIPIRRTS